MKTQLVKQLPALTLALAVSLATSQAQANGVAEEIPVPQHEVLSALSRTTLSTSQKIALISALEAAHKNDHAYKELLEGEFAPAVIPTILEVIEFYSQQSSNPEAKKTSSTRKAILWTCCGVGVGVVGFIAGIAYVMAAVKYL